MAKSRGSTCLAPDASLADLVHQRILEALVTGQFKSGAELNEVNLAAQFQVSRTPVREALRRLAAEELVVSQRNRHTTVVELSRQDVIDIYMVRQILESSAARLAAIRIDDDRLLALRGLAEAAGSAGDQQSGAERRFGDELHRSVAEACGNARLLREILRYHNLVRFIRSNAVRRPLRLVQGHSEHLELLTALEKHDPDRAESAMSNHIASALKAVTTE